MENEEFEKVVLTKNQKIYFNIVFIWMMIWVFDEGSSERKTMLDPMQLLYYGIPTIVLIILTIKGHAFIWWCLFISSIGYTLFQFFILFTESRNGLYSSIVFIGMCAALVTISVLLFKVKPEKK